MSEVRRPDNKRSTVNTALVRWADQNDFKLHSAKFATDAKNPYLVHIVAKNPVGHVAKLQYDFTTRAVTRA